MSDVTADAPETPEKSKKGPLIIGLALSVAGAAGGYFLVSSGMLFPAQSSDVSEPAPNHPTALPDIAFVEIEPIMISLQNEEKTQHLRFRSQLEVDAAHQKDVEHVLPRVIDVLNGYLRALEVKDLQDSMALTRLRSQMLRRIQVVVGKERVRDLLIMEFVLN